MVWSFWAVEVGQSGKKVNQHDGSSTWSAQVWLTVHWLSTFLHGETFWASFLQASHFLMANSPLSCPPHFFGFHAEESQLPTFWCYSAFGSLSLRKSPPTIISSFDGQYPSVIKPGNGCSQLYQPCLTPGGVLQVLTASYFQFLDDHEIFPEDFPWFSDDWRVEPPVVSVWNLIFPMFFLLLHLIFPQIFYMIPGSSGISIAGFSNESRGFVSGVHGISGFLPPPQVCHWIWHAETWTIEIHDVPRS